MKKGSGLGRGELIALIVGSSIGPGVYGICSDLATAAAPGPALIAWLVCGIGVFSLVLSMNNLLAKRPDLSSGIFIYAGAAFGPLGEFLSGWGILAFGLAWECGLWYIFDECSRLIYSGI